MYGWNNILQFLQTGKVLNQDARMMHVNLDWASNRNFNNKTQFFLQVSWVGVPTAPAWLPTDMLIKVFLNLASLKLVGGGSWPC
jgi:hypothetical protein